jgi:sulfide dehydrogenase cytochrome subunit
MFRKKMINRMIAGSLSLSSTAIAESVTPSMLANTCAGCHGTNGQSSGASIPTIAGLGAEYFVQIMQSYKDGKAISTIMGRLAKGYTDDDFKAMAEYYTKQPFMAHAQEYDADKAAKGAKLHAKHCESCHEDNGKSVESTGTILAGQWMEYLRLTIADLHSGKRATDDKTMKKKLASAVKKGGDEAIENLVHFYGSQK